MLKLQSISEQLISSGFASRHRNNRDKV